MAPAHLPGISILVLILGVELLGLWLLPRMGVVDIGPNLVIAWQSGAWSARSCCGGGGWAA